jgi:WD40 repeat protein
MACLVVKVNSCVFNAFGGVLTSALALCFIECQVNAFSVGQVSGWVQSAFGIFHTDTLFLPPMSTRVAFSKSLRSRVQTLCWTRQGELVIPYDSSHLLLLTGNGSERIVTVGTGEDLTLVKQSIYNPETLILGCSSGKAIYYDLQSQSVLREIHVQSGEILDLVEVTQQELLIIGKNGRVHPVDIDNPGRKVGPPRRLGEGFYSASYSHTRQLLASSSPQEHLVFFAYGTWERMRQPIHPSGIVNCQAWNEQESLLALGLLNSNIEVYSIESQQSVVLVGHEARITGLAICSDNRLLASKALDDTLRLWDIQTGTCLEVIATSEALEMSPMSFKPGSYLLAALDEENSLIKLLTCNPTFEEVVKNASGNANISFHGSASASTVFKSDTNDSDSDETAVDEDTEQKGVEIESRYELEIEPKCLSDLPAETDSIGFEPYVDALARFLSIEQTKAPLTVAIEGEWGMGKTSFMRQLRKSVMNESSVYHHTIWFEAWRYQNGTDLSKAFASEFVEQISSSVDTSQRLWKNSKLLVKGVFRRQQRLTVWIELILRLLFWVSFLGSGLTVVFALFSSQDILGPLALILDKGETAPAVKWMTRVFDSFFFLALIFYALVYLRKFYSDTFAKSFKEVVAYPTFDKPETVSSIFQGKINKIITEYTGGKRLFVFLDDLDRCDPNQLTELLRTLQQLLPAESNVIFVIGLDREAVAASVASNYSSIVDAQSGGRPEARVEWGLRFMEKIVQIPFPLPRAATINYQPSYGLNNSPARPIAKVGNTMFYSNDLAEIESVDLEPYETVIRSESGERPDVKFEPLERLIFEKSPSVNRIEAEAFQILKNNPRNQKRFVNLFRLHAYIAYNLGVLNVDDVRNDERKTTLYKVGRLTLLALKWPLLSKQFMHSPDLLIQLQQFAFNRPSMIDSPATNSEMQKIIEGDSELMSFLRGEDALNVQGPLGLFSSVDAQVLSYIPTI